MYYDLDSHLIIKREMPRLHSCIFGVVTRDYGDSIYIDCFGRQGFVMGRVAKDDEVMLVDRMVYKDDNYGTLKIRVWIIKSKYGYDNQLVWVGLAATSFAKDHTPKQSKLYPDFSPSLRKTQVMIRYWPKSYYMVSEEHQDAILELLLILRHWIDIPKDLEQEIMHQVVCIKFLKS